MRLFGSVTDVEISSIHPTAEKGTSCSVATLAKKRHIAVELSDDQVLVRLDSLGSRQLYHEYAAERRGWVPLEVLERELLADLEAVQWSLAARGLLTDTGLIQAVQVVDSTVVGAVSGAARA